jgi:hypothetical protein
MHAPQKDSFQPGTACTDVGGHQEKSSQTEISARTEKWEEGEGRWQTVRSAVQALIQSKTIWGPVTLEIKNQSDRNLCIAHVQETAA